MERERQAKTSAINESEYSQFLLSQDSRNFPYIIKLVLNSLMTPNSLVVFLRCHAAMQCRRFKCCIGGDMLIAKK